MKRIALVVLILALFAACSNGDDDQGQRARGAQRSSTTKPEQPEEQNAGKSVLAARDVSYQEGNFRLEITGLTQTSDNMVTLKVRATNLENEIFVGLYQAISGPSNVLFDSPYLVDSKNKKKYLVVEDTNGRCVCSHIRGMQANETFELFASFPAPPKSVDRLDVVISNQTPFEDVPISR